VSGGGGPARARGFRTAVPGGYQRKGAPRTRTKATIAASGRRIERIRDMTWPSGGGGVPRGARGSPVGRADPRILPSRVPCDPWPEGTGGGPPQEP